MELAWGNRVSITFCERVLWIAGDLGFDPSDLMACMAFESAESFRADIKHPKSNAIGLIQFMPSTASALGTSTEELSKMTPEDQLNYVWKYFAPRKGKLVNLGDLYMAVLWPGGIGKPDSAVLFSKNGPYAVQYAQNRGLDVNKDGEITRGEAVAKVYAKLTKGLGAGLVRTMPD